MDLIKNLYKDNKAMVIFLSIFMILQPFFDMKFFFENPDLKLFGLTIPTIFRCGGVFIIFLLSLKNVKKDNTHLFYAIYFFVLGIYILFHHIVTSGTVNVPSSYSYSLFNELFYFIRMIFPFILVYAVKYTKISYHSFINIILISSLLIGLIIIVSNLFHVSLPSYAIGGKHTKFNIIEWFTMGTNLDIFESYTSKGWFYMANQISGLMVLLLPLNLYDFIKRTNLLNFFSSLSLSVSMLLLGTRISSYGLIGILLVMLMISIFFVFFRKEIKIKNVLMYIILASFIGMLFIKSPIHNRVYSFGEVEEIEELDQNEIDDNKTNKNTNEKFILNNYENKKIQKVYIFKLYPYTFDNDFWVDFIKNNEGEVKQNREIQTQITKRIAALNPSLKYDLFGYSFSRFRNGHMYIENDFIVHYFTIGIIGICLLLGPWLYIILKSLYGLLKNKGKKLNFLTISLLFSMCVCLGASLFSGHVVDELIVTLYLGFIGGYLLYVMREDKENV